MQLRPRGHDDLGPLETLARSVHAADGYPPYLPDDDFVGFLDSSEAIATWVALIDDRLVGQISLHTGSSPEVMSLAADRLDVAPRDLAVVARLLVDPRHRRVGIAQALLGAAQAEAAARGLVAILDVVERFTSAIALYERQGWTRLGTVEVDLPDGSLLTEHVYAAPA